MQQEKQREIDVYTAPFDPIRIVQNEGEVFFLINIIFVKDIFNFDKCVMIMSRLC